MRQSILPHAGYRVYLWFSTEVLSVLSGFKVYTTQHTVYSKALLLVLLKNRSANFMLLIRALLFIGSFGECDNQR